MALRSSLHIENTLSNSTPSQKRVETPAEILSSATTSFVGSRLSFILAKSLADLAASCVILDGSLIDVTLILFTSLVETTFSDPKPSRELVETPAEIFSTAIASSLEILLSFIPAKSLTKSTAVSDIVVDGVLTPSCVS